MLIWLENKGLLSYNDWKQLIIVTKTINYRKFPILARKILTEITTDNFWGFFSFTYVLIKSAILPKTTINIGGNNG